MDNDLDLKHELDSHIVERDFYLWDAIGFNAFTREKCIDAIFEVNRISMETGVSTFVTFSGVPAAISAVENNELKKVYASATLTLMDGMPIVKKARRRGIACDRCCGPDIILDVIAKGNELGKRHFFYGCTDETLNKISDSLKEKYPNIIISGLYAPPFRELTPDEEVKIINMINEAEPDFLWVGLGSPKQDEWMANHISSIKKCTMFGVGAAFNFISGSIKRPPKIIEKLSLEWLYRFFQEPKRLFKRNIGGFFKYIKYSLRYGRKGKTKNG